MTTSPQGRRRTAAAVGIAVLLLAGLVYLGRGRPAVEIDAKAVPSKTGADDIDVASPSSPSPIAKQASAGRPPSTEAEALDGDDAAVVVRLQEKFGKSIFHKHSQIKALEELMFELRKRYPDDWQSRMLDFLRQAFPDRADTMYAQFQKLMQFNDWMRDNRHELVQMDARDRREALWDTRRQFFGEDADEIWEVTQRNEKILDSLESVGDAGGLTEKLDTYVEAIDEAYGEQAEQFVQRRQTELMLRFLAVESVQDDLHSQSPEERRQSLREVRRAMGLDDDALARLEALDEERDREWSTGEEYLKERADIVEQFQGQEQERRLAELQGRIFGEQAETIREEETAGFFRFQHRRVFGRE